MTDFFREVDEEVRRDKAIDFFRRYQTIILVVALAILVAAGGWRWWQTKRQADAEAAGARYEDAVQLARDGKLPEAEAALKQIATDGPAGYALLARFRAAATTSANDPDAAVKMYDALAADSSVEPLMREVARLRAALLVVDKGDQKEIAARIEPLAGPTSAFHATARELLALDALKRNDMATAGKWLDMIVTDPRAPAALRQRAEAMLGLVAGGGPAPAPAQAQTPAPATAPAQTPAPETK